MTQVFFIIIQPFEKAFQSPICHVTPGKLPFIACQACSTLLGYESCTNTWYGNGFYKKCSECNTPRGLPKTFILKGFENLVHQLELYQKNRHTFLFFLVLCFGFANDNNFFQLTELHILHFLKKFYVFMRKCLIFTHLTHPSIICSKLTQKTQPFILF